MPRALAKIGDRIIAETASWKTVENNVYFPRSAIIDDSILQDSDRSTFCSWKGYASYWHLKVGGRTLENAAWYYPDPYDAAADIKDHVAFWFSTLSTPAAHGESFTKIKKIDKIRVNLLQSIRSTMCYHVLARFEMAPHPFYALSRVLHQLEKGILRMHSIIEEINSSEPKKITLDKMDEYCKGLQTVTNHLSR